MSPLVGVGLSELDETLDVRRSLGRCLNTSLLLTSIPAGSLMSEDDLTVNRDSPPECVRALEGEWFIDDDLEVSE